MSPPPWQHLDGLPPSEAIRRLFAPLGAEIPRFIAALVQTCVRLESEQDREGRWRLVYHLQRDIPEPERAWTPVERTLMGGAPCADPVAPDGVVIPEALQRFYAIHDGFGSHMSDFGVGCLAPARQLGFPLEDRPDWLEYHCDDGGHRQLLLSDPFDPDAPRRSLDWDRETGELGCPRSIFEFIDINLTRDILGVESLPDHPTPAAVLPVDRVLSDWGHLPGGPLAGASVIGTIYSRDITLGHSEPVGVVFSRWIAAFEAAGWTVEAAALQDDRRDARVSRGWRKLELLVAAGARGVIAAFHRPEARSARLPASWAARGLPIGEAHIQGAHGDPVPHLALSYPGAALAAERARWLAGLSDWAVTDRGGVILLRRGGDALMLSMRQEPLGVAVLLYEDDTDIPEAWAALRPLQTGPVRDVRVSGATMVWSCSGHPHHHSHPAALAAMHGFIAALQADGWVSLPVFLDPLGLGVWLHRAGQEWTQLTLSHTEDYDANLYLSRWTAATAPASWAGIALPVGEGWVESVSETTLHWCAPWPVSTPRPGGLGEARDGGTDGLERAEAQWRERLVGQGWRHVDSVFTRGTRTITIEADDFEEHVRITLQVEA